MAGGKKKNPNRKFYKPRQNGPPKGGDGTGEFKGTAMTQYRQQPLPEMLSTPGIIVTTVQTKEKIAEAEIIDALEQAADELYPGTGGGTNSEEDDEEDGDIEDVLQKELEGLTSGKVNKSARFRVCKRDAPCVVYINVLPPLDPVALVRNVIERCDRTGRCSFRFVQRLTPVSSVSTASLAQLGEMAAALLPAHFAAGPQKFAIQTTTRNSDKLDRMDMIQKVADEVTKLSSEHKVDLKHPDLTIMVELYKGSLGLSVVKDFDKYKKFNPAAVARQAAKAADEAGAAEDNVGGTAEEKTRTVGQARAENRVRRADGIRAAQETEAAKASTAATPAKRKIDSEDGQVSTTAADVESGEVVEDESADLGDNFDEVITGGRVVKVRRQE